MTNIIEALYGCDNCGSELQPNEMLCDRCLLADSKANLRQLDDAYYLSLDCRHRLRKQILARIERIQNRAANP